MYFRHLLSLLLMVVAIVAWPCGANADTHVPWTFVDNRPFVAVTVNGRELQFVVDTGGDYAIDRSVASRIGLVARAAGTTTGAGEARAQVGTVTVKRFCLASACVANPVFDVLDLTTIAKRVGLGHLDGIVGYAFLRTRIVTFAYGENELVIRDAVPADLTGSPFTLYGTIPTIDASVDGKAGRFILDTGDRANLTLFPAFAAASGFHAVSPALTGVTTGAGVGGPIRSDVFVARDVHLGLGDVAATNVVTRISRAHSGGFATSAVSGSIGSGLLRRYDVTLDYGRSRLYLKPLASFPPVSCASPSPNVIPPLDCFVQP